MHSSLVKLSVMPRSSNRLSRFAPIQMSFLMYVVFLNTSALTRVTLTISVTSTDGRHSDSYFLILLYDHPFCVVLNNILKRHLTFERYVTQNSGPLNNSYNRLDQLFSFKPRNNNFCLLLFYVQNLSLHTTRMVEIQNVI